MAYEDVGFGEKFNEEKSALCRTFGLNPQYIKELDVKVRIADDEIVCFEASFVEYATGDKIRRLGEHIEKLKAKGERVDGPT